MHIPAALKFGGSDAKEKKKAVAKKVKSNKSTQRDLREQHREPPHGRESLRYSSAGTVSKDIH